MHLIDTFALLALTLIGAKLLGGVFQKRGIPSVLAELLAGILLGNLAPWVGGVFGSSVASLETSTAVKTLSELGVLLLLFLVGLETNLKELSKVGRDAGQVAVVGVLVPFALAFGILPLVDNQGFQHTLFMAAALSATSVGITARVLRDLGKLSSVSGQTILGAAVIDDVLGIVILAVVSSLATRGSVSGPELAGLGLRIALFGVAVWVARRFVLPKAIRRIRPLEVAGTVTVLLISLCLLAAWGAEQAGLAGIVGAFALGLALDDVQFKGFQEKSTYTLEQLMKPVTDFLVPIFFVVMGMSVKLDALGSREALSMALLLTACAIVGKLVCGLALTPGARRRGADGWLVGFGMMPRGEVGLIFAAMGTRLGLLNEADYAAVVGMVAVTTLLAPGLISMRARSADRRTARAR